LEVSGQFHAPAALTPEKGPPVPIGYEAGWAPHPSSSERRGIERILDSNTDPSVVQPVASCYTDYAISAYSFVISFPNIFKFPTFSKKYEKLL
jgi:hypothetical protein